MDAHHMGVANAFLKQIVSGALHFTMPDGTSQKREHAQQQMRTVVAFLRQEGLAVDVGGSMMTIYHGGQGGSPRPSFSLSSFELTSDGRMAADNSIEAVLEDRRKRKELADDLLRKQVASHDELMSIARDGAEAAKTSAASAQIANRRTWISAGIAAAAAIAAFGAWLVPGGSGSATTVIVQPTRYIESARHGDATPTTDMALPDSSSGSTKRDSSHLVAPKP